MSSQKVDKLIDKRSPSKKQVMELSDEQKYFISLALQGHNVLVDACIGSGKTTAIQALCNAFPETKRILYLTYNKLLKVEAKAKIKNKNVTATNYHGYASCCLMRAGIHTSVPDLLKTFNRAKVPVGKYDVLILDEYQDIYQEIAEMLNKIKQANPGIQIIAVGDMAQKIYDYSTLDVRRFMDSFLGNYKLIEFTLCFRLDDKHARYLGEIWNKKIIGVNKDFRLSCMTPSNVTEFLASFEPKNILCLGSQYGQMSKVLNELEAKYPDKFNKNTVYASISDSNKGRTEPNRHSAIFTTYDSSKGLERDILVLFDFTEAYWTTRLSKPTATYEILRNIFCVAASRGKREIVLVLPNKGMVLSQRTLSTPVSHQMIFEKPFEMSNMFEYKYLEDVDACYDLLKTTKIPSLDESVIEITKYTDGLIDLSPCIGKAQEAIFFTNYSIDNEINYLLSCRKEQEYLYDLNIKRSSVEQKILFLTALETYQNRYMNQVSLPFITKEEEKQICDRLSTEFSRDENIQKPCTTLLDPEGLLTATGIADVVKNDIVYELKFVSELSHEHFLQCASYVVAMGLPYGILWNVRTNEKYKVEVPDIDSFKKAVAIAVTKGYARQLFR